MAVFFLDTLPAFMADFQSVSACAQPTRLISPSASAMAALSEYTS